VTGGAGFIGSHVAEHLVKQGNRVVVLDELSGGLRENVPRNVDFVEGSILDADLMDSIFRDYGVTHVFHLAAYAAEGLSHFIRRCNYSNNLVGSANVVNAAVNHNCRCFVFTSSIAVYGTNQLPMTEDVTPRPEDPYGVAKYAVEMDLEAARHMYGLDYIVFRPHNVYGERQNLADPYRNVLGIFMRQLMEGQEMTVFGDGEQTRAFTYIDDVAPVIADSINHPDAHNQVFNVGSSDPRSVNDVARVIADALDKELIINHLPERNEVRHAYSGHEKLERILDYRPRWSLEEGVTRMVAWARDQEFKPSRLFAEIEIERNMPESWKALMHGPDVSGSNGT